MTNVAILVLHKNTDMPCKIVSVFCVFHFLLKSAEMCFCCATKRKTKNAVHPEEDTQRFSIFSENFVGENHSQMNFSKSK